MLKWSQLSQSEQQQALARPEQSQSSALFGQVSDIVEKVKQDGDQALLNMTEEFDGVRLNDLKVTQQEFEQAEASLTDDLKAALKLAISQVEAFHQAQVFTPIKVETTAGVVCEWLQRPISNVGLYVPGGTAPLPSTVIMLATPARIAGCKKRILCTPPNKEGCIHPAILYSAMLCEIDTVYKVGGAQAIAAMAFGTETVDKVDKIFGPGNRFVTAAKQYVSNQGAAAIDMPAGPSEVLVLADGQANPDFVAADLLSQAEHGSDSQSLLVSDSEALIREVNLALKRQIATLSRRDIAAQAMDNSQFILTDSIEQSVSVSNQYGPEHLIVQTESPRTLLPLLDNAASIFLGPWSPESAGDYASGTNHVLPTYGFSRSYSALGLADFAKRFAVQELSPAGISAIGPAIMTIADAEGLDAHKQAVALRLAALANQQETRDCP